MLANLFHSIPPITRTQILTISFLTFLVESQVVSKYQMYFSMQRIFSGQIWRLLTSWQFFQNADIYFIFRIVMLVQFSSSIQKTAFKRGSIDYLYFLVLLCFGIYILATLFSISYLTDIYFYTICYYYGRINSNQLIVINFLPLRAPYLLWFLLMLEWIAGDYNLKSTLLSVFLGHTLYFLFNIYPKLIFVSYRQLFDTPRIMINYLSPMFQGDNFEHIE